MMLAWNSALCMKYWWLPESLFLDLYVDKVIDDCLPEIIHYAWIIDSFLKYLSSDLYVDKVIDDCFPVYIDSLIDDYLK